MRVKYSEWGLANRFGDTILLNENLKYYPRLREILIDHELTHERNPLKNIKIDIDSVKNIGFLEAFMRIKFMLKHPKSLIQMSPVWIYKRRPYFDLSLILIYLIIGSMFILTRWLS